ncbi:MAG: hypothetical protein IKK15_05565 [Akkermansia sp.]|nr:hypothetical protein [Akkermansia sp.]
MRPNINWFPDTKLTFPNIEKTEYAGLTSYEAVNKAVTNESAFVVVAHGTPHYILNKENKKVYAKDFANIILKEILNIETTIELLCCETGLLKNGFAQQLANHLARIWREKFPMDSCKGKEVTVMAPEKKLIIQYLEDNSYALAYETIVTDPIDIESTITAYDIRIELIDAKLRKFTSKI